MRKWNMMLLALLLVIMPAAGLAQDMGLAQPAGAEPVASAEQGLEELFTEVYESIGEGLHMGAQQAQMAVQSDLTLRMETESARLEEGKTVLLEITAGNPLPQDTAVSFALALPGHVTANGETAWEAVLPAAGMDAETGEMIPSETVITREITLEAGGERSQAQIQCEMAMGSRFYRALSPLQLCVPQVDMSVLADGTMAGRLNPGDSFAYRLVFTNTGDAPKDMTVEMTLPETVTAGELPEGFAREGDKLCGVVHVPAAQDTAARREIVFPVTVKRDALADDEDAQRLIAPVVSANGENVTAPRTMVCGPKISARLMAGSESLETGEETLLSVVVVNGGLAEADVQLSCVLPEGLTLAQEEEENETGALLPAGGDDGQLPGAGEAIPAEDAPAEPAMHQDDHTLVFDLHMDAARQSADGVIASTQVIEIPVRAEIAKERMTQQMLGTSLAWRVDDEQAQLGEAVAMSVRPQTVLGLTRADWNGVFWAGVLLLVTVVCLYAAVKREKREADYCFE
ncbi:MAG: hypothetical protein IJ418_21725 [Clostridia bacterium]|nr:hypothetical protein [Clostridia bacterium]